MCLLHLSTPHSKKKFISGHEVEGKESWVYLLVKALYGTKQAAHAWQQHLKKLLEEDGFISLTLDPATYTKRKGDAFTLVGTHVDDLFVVSNMAGRTMRTQLWSHLTSKLKIKTLGEATWTLQMLIQRDAEAGVLKLSQEAFILEMLRRFKFDDITSAPTPAADAGAEASMSDTTK